MGRAHGIGQPQGRSAAQGAEVENVVRSGQFHLAGQRACVSTCVPAWVSPRDQTNTVA